MANKNFKKEIGWLLKEKYNNIPTSQFKKDIRKLEAGEPLDYVIGFTEFLGCKIDLSKKPLIPRSETEFWTERAIEEIEKVLSFPRKRESRKSKKNLDLRFRGDDIRVLDIFAGSGCIGVAVLKHIKNAKCDFIDIDENDLKQIRINCKLNNINIRRYKVIRADVLKNIKGKYDYIFVNPPYISKTRRSKIQKSVLRFEPMSALFGGGDGLLYIRKFLSQAKNHLNPGGKIFMEFDSIQKKEIEKLVKKNGYQNYEFYKDQYGKWRQLVVF